MRCIPPILSFTTYPWLPKTAIWYVDMHRRPRGEQLSVGVCDELIPFVKTGFDVRISDFS